MRTVRDISYAHAGQHALLLDLYLPDGLQRPFPVVVWIHGGAWWEGNKENPPVVSMNTTDWSPDWVITVWSCAGFVLAGNASRCARQPDVQSLDPNPMMGIRMPGRAAMARLQAHSKRTVVVA